MDAQVKEYRIVVGREWQGAEGTKMEWTKIGTIRQADNGKWYGFLDFIPVKNWDGRFSIFPKD